MSTSLESRYDLIRELVLIDEHMIPSEPGYSLYIRPTCIGTQVGLVIVTGTVMVQSWQAILGVLPPTDAKLFVISSPVGP